MSESEILRSVCRLLVEGGDRSARGLLSDRLPFTPWMPVERQYSRETALRVFRRDGFVCRYSGKRLVFPGTLRLLSVLLPVQFPFHPQWKPARTHLAYWQLHPAVDQIVPVTRGGKDEDSNLATTSQLRVSAKSSWLLEELGWRLLPPEDLRGWDGLSGWFGDFVAAHPQVLQKPSVKSWHDALRRAG